MPVDDGTVVDTKGWCGWDWTQGVALTVLVHVSITAMSPASDKRTMLCLTV